MRLGIGIENRDWGLEWCIGIGDSRLGIGIGDWGSELGIGDWVWDWRSGIDKRELRLGIGLFGDCDWVL